MYSDLEERRMIACFYIPQAGIATERARLGLWGEPLALVADGIVVAASDEAARHGVQAQQMAQPPGRFVPAW